MGIENLMFTPESAASVTHALAEFLARHPKRAEAFVLDLADRLIQEKDAADGDPDFERDIGDEPHDAEPDACACDDYGGEPSLGAPEVEFTMRGLPERRGHINQERWTDGGVRHGEDEPTLGATEMHSRLQDEWSHGYQRKPEHEECEDVSEDEGACIQSHPHDGETDKGEHSLGWTNGVNQLRLGMPSDEHEYTAPERHGAGFIQCVPDDHEDDDREAVNEDGCALGGLDNGIADDGGVSDQWGRHTSGHDYV